MLSGDVTVAVAIFKASAEVLSLLHGLSYFRDERSEVCSDVASESAEAIRLSSVCCLIMCQTFHQLQGPPLHGVGPAFGHNCSHAVC